MSELHQRVPGVPRRADLSRRPDGGLSNDGPVTATIFVEKAMEDRGYDPVETAIARGDEPRHVRGRMYEVVKTRGEARAEAERAHQAGVERLRSQSAKAKHDSGNAESIDELDQVKVGMDENPDFDAE